MNLKSLNNLNVLGIITGGLFILSLVVFWNENRRGTDLTAGSDYIKGLDIEKVAKIVLNFKGDKKLSLLREGGQFVLEGHKSYPASTQKVNDLIYKIASIRIKELIRSEAKEEDLEKYELGSQSRHYLIEFFDRGGERNLAFRVGKNRSGKGNYLFKEGQEEVYVSEGPLWFSSDVNGVIDDVLVEFPQEDVFRVAISSDKKIEFEKKEKDYKITFPPEAKKFAPEKAKEYIKEIKKVRFDEFFLAGEDLVSSLKFGHSVSVQLKNKLVYTLEVAKKKKEDFFARLRAKVVEVPQQIQISRGDNQEKLKGVEAIVLAQGKAQRVNQQKGGWVYKIGKDVYEKIARPHTFFFSQ